VSDLPPRVLELADEAAAEHGVEVLDARLLGGKGGRTLEIVLDADHPVESDVIEQVARRLTSALDEEDPIQGRYFLEVATPGLDRPLTRARDFRRQLGHRVAVQLRDGTSAEGDVAAVDDAVLTLDTGKEQVQIQLTDIGSGKVVLPW
jgi:ribosome maturation factor RimP